MPVEQAPPARTVDLRSLEEPPFETLLEAMDDRVQDETVEIVVGYAPVPLSDSLETRGWPYEAVRERPDEWRVRVGRPLDHAVRDDSERHSGECLRRPRTERLPRTTRP